MKNRTLLKSFKYAGQGLKTAFCGERNFRIHCAAAILVIIMGFFCRISAGDWALVFMAMGFVLVCEIINTAGETLVDMVTREYSQDAKKVKDLLAGAVLISAAAAVLVGIFVFAGPVMEWIARWFQP